MYAEPEFVRSGRLSRRYSVQVAASRNGIRAEWTPDTPDKLTRQEMRRYRQIRDAAIAELAAHIGGGVAVVELAGGFAPDGN
jgi:hypothetical protein